MSSSFRILIAWWVRWVWQRRLWRIWIWIRLRWYVRYRIGWVVLWHRIVFRCHAFWLWVMWWWWRFTCCPISKECLWSGYRQRCVYQMYGRNVSISSCRRSMSCYILLFFTPWKNIFYCTDIGWIIDWSVVFQIGWNELILVGVFQINVNRVGIFVIPNYRIFAPNLFNFKNIFSLNIFGNVVACKVFTLTFRCAMPWWSPIGKIRRPDDRVKDIAVDRNVNVWYYGSGESLRVHPSAFINIMPGSSASNISNTIKTTKGGVVSITVSS